MSVIKIPANTTDLKKTLSTAFNKKPGEKEPDKVDPVSRRTATEIHKQREKSRALTAELNDAKTSDARKQEIIDGLQAQLDSSQSELEAYKDELEKAKPAAKKWSDHEHKQRTRLLESLPPEERKDAKAIADSMDIETFGKYVAKIGKAPASADTTSGDKTKGKDWNAIMSGPDADKEIAADKAGFNAFMDSQK